MNRKTEQLNGAIGAYFAACDATRERRELKNGGIEERQIPYTLFGLARAVRLTPKEILSAFHTERRSETNAILRDAVLKVAAYTLDRDAYDSGVAQNENNLNQNLELLYNKLLELESALADQTEGE